MKKQLTSSIFLSAALLGAADTTPPNQKPKLADTSNPKPGIVTTQSGQMPEPGQDDTTKARVVYVHEGDVFTMICPAMMDCSIESPKGEKFVSASLGDPVHWPDTKNSLPSRFYSVKTGFHGMRTTLHLQTDHDNQYTFRLEERSTGYADYTIILKSDDAEINQRIASQPVVVPREEADALKQQLGAVLKELSETKKDASKQEQKVEAKVVKMLPGEIRTYQFDQKKAHDKPWLINDITGRGDFTYIRRSVKSPDLPSIVAINANGGEELVMPHYDPDNDVYVIPQRIEKGYLSFAGNGKRSKKLLFEVRKGAA